LPNVKAVLDVTNVVNDLNSAVKKATNEIQHSHILNWCNFLTFAIFVLVVGITCWQMFSANNTLSTTSSEISQISSEVSQIRKGIYNSQGWSAIVGSEKNEWVFSHEHPEDYKNLSK